MEKRIPNLKIFGYSDDLVEIYGSRNVDEIDCFDKDVFIEFTDGTEIKIHYGKNHDKTGIWAISVSKEGSAPHTLTICNDENTEIYSDIFKIQAEVKNVRRMPLNWKEKS